MLTIVLLVCFVVVMLLWFFSNLGPTAFAVYYPWLAWLACLILGIMVFLIGWPTIRW